MPRAPSALSLPIVRRLLARESSSEPYDAIAMKAQAGRAASRRDAARAGVDRCDRIWAMVEVAPRLPRRLGSSQSVPRAPQQLVDKAQGPSAPSRRRWDRDHGISTGPQLELLRLYGWLAREATTYLRVQLLY
jgi:hypothetical protein